jgi:very-short-patch-repair endonuclease
LESFRFRRQAPIGRYIVDFLCAERRLIVELDGGQHVEQQKDHDEVRTRWLESRGYHVVRFWNSDVLANTVGVLEAIRAELIAAGAASTPHPNPPPQGGRG